MPVIGKTAMRCTRRSLILLALALAGAHPLYSQDATRPGEEGGLLAIADSSCRAWESLKTSYGATSLEALLAAASDEVDIATASLVLAKRYDDRVDVAEGVRRVDDIARGLLASMPAKIEPERAVAMVSTYIFDRYASTRAGFMINPTEGFLSTVLDSGQGNCLGLSTLYLAVCRRLGLPVYLVRMPKHVFVRYADDTMTINIESTYRGATRGDETYLPNLNPGERAGRLHNLTRREEIAVLLANLASAWARKGELDAAVRVCEDAIALKLEDPIVHNNLGSAWLRKGDREKAEASFTRAIELDGGYTGAFGNRAMTRAMLGKLSDALCDYDRALGLDPGDPRLYNNRGSVFFVLGDLDRALADFDQAVALDPEYIRALENRGDAWSSKGDAEKAARDRDKARELARAAGAAALE